MRVIGAYMCLNVTLGHAYTYTHKKQVSIGIGYLFYIVTGPPGHRATMAHKWDELWSCVGVRPHTQSHTTKGICKTPLCGGSTPYDMV